MLDSLKEIFQLGTIEINDRGERTKLNSHTSEGQGIFLQELYSFIKPQKSLEVGFAFGISTLFILEKCRELNAEEKSHIVIEPMSWGEAAIYNIRKEGLEKYIDIRNDFSDVVLPRLFLNKERIQFAYVDTTKVFDIVLQDFYFIDKLLDVGGVIVFDDANTGGINVVMRFINSLPHYEIMEKYKKSDVSNLYKAGEWLFRMALSLVPLKRKYMRFYNLKTRRQLDLDYQCIAFRKIAKDTRPWNWDKAF